MIRTRVKINEHPALRGLCGSCEYAHIRSHDTGEDQVICGAISGAPSQRQVARKVVECSDHSPKGGMDLHSMKAVGWILDVTSGKIVGFRPPDKKKPWEDL